MGGSVEQAPRVLRRYRVDRDHRKIAVDRMHLSAGFQDASKIPKDLKRIVDIDHNVLGDHQIEHGGLDV